MNEDLYPGPAEAMRELIWKTRSEQHAISSEAARAQYLRSMASREPGVPPAKAEPSGDGDRKTAAAQSPAGIFL
jgi:hypothetical protein